MIIEYATQPDGTQIIQPDGTPLIAYAYQPAPPAAPGYTMADFTAALLALLPPGPVWPRDEGATLPTVSRGLALTYTRLSKRAAALLQDAPAGLLVEMLPEWEATLGLPDPCGGADQTVEMRRGQVLARIGARGGQSVRYFIAAAAALGFEIGIDEFAPSIYGQARYDDAYADEAWAHTWRVSVLSQPVTASRYGQAYYSERYTTWGNTVLECELDRIKPAHALLIFAYPQGGTANPVDDFVLDRDVLVA